MEVRSWCRVDLAGGTLDIWPLGLLHPGSRTVNVAIDLPVEVCVRPSDGAYQLRQGGAGISVSTLADLRAHPDGALAGVVLAHFGIPPVEVDIRSASPRGGGLGGSSALVVALITACEVFLDRGVSTVPERVALARDLEAQLMSLPTGTQDHYPGLLGGVLELCHVPGGTEVRQIETDLHRLGESLVIAYTGESHFSAGANWTVVRRRLEQDAEIRSLFAGISLAASEVAAGLEAGDLPRVGAAMGGEWRFRKRLAPGISVPSIERLLAAASGAGAWGGKACGAGGGGCVAVLCPSERRLDVEEALQKAGGTSVLARPTQKRLELLVGEERLALDE